MDSPKISLERILLREKGEELFLKWKTYQLGAMAAMEATEIMELQQRKPRIVALTQFTDRIMLFRQSNKAKVELRIRKLRRVAFMQFSDLTMWSRLPNKDQTLAKSHEMIELIKWGRTIRRISPEIKISTAFDLIDIRIKEIAKQPAADDTLMIALADSFIVELFKEYVRLALIRKFNMVEKLDAIDKCEKQLKKIDSSIRWLKKRMKVKSKN